MISKEGANTILYRSQDFVDNTEESKTQEVIIDKTAPEFEVQFNLDVKKFTFEATDNLDPAPALVCVETNCSILDAAGNTTVVTLKQSKILNIYSVQMTSIAYNDSPVVTLPKNAFIVQYRERNGSIEAFRQGFLMKDQEVLAILYDTRRDTSTIVTYDPETRRLTRETVMGKRFLRLMTENGKMNSSVVQ